LSGLSETAGQLAQAGLGLTFQALLLVTIPLEGHTHLLEEVRGEGEDTGFTLGADGQGGRAVGLAASAVAGAFAAAATQGNKGAAQQKGGSGRFGWF
jgi:hypothetical protein